MGVAIIQQRISATDDFDGTLPPGTPVSEKDIKRFPEAAAGGLFDFAIDSPHVIRSVELHLGGQSVWSIAKKDSDGDEIVYWAGTTETDFVTISEDFMLLYEDEKLLVRTTGATAALKCRIAIQRLE
jgi:hypothetical protein